MSIQKDIQRLFELVLQKYDGNKAAAAASLGINPVTFWGWVKGNRKKKEVLFDAIDRAGARLLLPNDVPPRLGEPEKELETLRSKVDSLTRENELLSKLVKKYEDDESEKKVPLAMDSSTRARQQIQPFEDETRD